jgi:hypothetical protein
MKGIVMSLVLVGVVATSAGIVRAGDWQLRSNSRGVCSLQPSDAVPLLGQPLGRSPTKREACDAARARREGPPGEKGKCVGYTPNTAKLCASEGVELRK